MEFDALGELFDEHLRVLDVIHGYQTDYCLPACTCYTKAPNHAQFWCNLSNCFRETVLLVKLSKRCLYEANRCSCYYHLSSFCKETLKLAHRFIAQLIYHKTYKTDGGLKWLVEDARFNQFLRNHLETTRNTIQPIFERLSKCTKNHQSVLFYFDPTLMED